MAKYTSGEAEFMKIGFFKNAWFITFAVMSVILIVCGLMLIGIVYLTSGLRFDPFKFGMDDLGFEDY